MADGDQVALLVADEDAGQARISRSPSLAFVETNGVTYHEVVTALPLGDRTLVFLAFWRDGDAAGELLTRAGYELILSSLRFVP